VPGDQRVPARTLVRMEELRGEDLPADELHVEEVLTG
jgi:hypothetical protein